MIQFVLAILSIISVSIIDGASSSFFASICVFGITSLFSLRLKNHRTDSFNLNLTVFFIYYVSAYIVSTAFSAHTCFMVSDSMRYIESYMNRTSFNLTFDELYNHYLTFNDNNILYNSYLAYVSVFMNNVIGNNSVFAMTLCNTVFGILSINSLYELLLHYFDADKAKKYTLIFAVFSIFFIYSDLIIRDIIITFFFLRAFNIVIRPFSIKGLLILAIYMLLVWGVRLYTGFFYGIFIMQYIYLRFYNTKYKFIAVTIFMILALFVVGMLIGSAAMEQTSEKLDNTFAMTENAVNDNGGLIANLFKLPFGIKQVAIALYTQMAPFPSYGPLMQAETFPQIWMSLSVMVYELFWFFIFYTMFISIFTKRSFQYLDQWERTSLLIAFLLILSTTAHPDLRRMMACYPIIYLIYLKLKNYHISRSWFSGTTRKLALVYIILAFTYSVLKFA